jgi:glycosyltransferase involved in cell wall biosynthesis
MNILFTSHKFFPDIGGIESHSEILAGHLASAGFRLILATQSESGGYRQFPYPILRKVCSTTLRQALRNADLVYQNNIELRTLWPAIGLRKPLVISIHTWLRGTDGRRRLVDLLKKFILSRAARVICVSDALRRDTFDRALVVPNPYDDHMFRKMPDVTRDRAVVFLGRLVSDKGADLLVDAFAHLVTDREFQAACARQRVHSKLTIIGTGDEEQALKTMVSNRNLSDCVEFCGSVSGEKLVSILNRHKVIAVPSRWLEPFGMVALEGMACGCVPIGSDGGGLPDAIGHAGLTFAKNSMHGLIESIRRLFLEPHLMNDLNARADAHLARHKKEVVCARYLEILQSVKNGILR